MKKISRILMFALIFCAFGITTAVTLNSAKADSGMNFTKVTILNSNGTPYSNVEVKLSDKVYITDAKGQFLTEKLPYGAYSPSIKLNDENNVWQYEIFSKKIKIDRYSHMDSLTFLNNIYVYKKFNLAVTIVNTANTPISNMKISVYKKDVLVVQSTVTTCVYGNITFNWQEMPNSSGQENGINIGDELTVMADYQGANNPYLQASRTILLDSPNEYAKLVAFKKGESELTNVPKLYSVENFYTVDEKKTPINNVAQMVFDYGIKVVNQENVDNIALDKKMFSLKNSFGNEVEIKAAYLRYNTVNLEYDYSVKNLETVSYTAEGDKYIVNQLNNKVKVAAIKNANADLTSNDNDLNKQYEDEVIRLVNEERSRAGLNELIKDDVLTRMSRIKSNDLYFNGYLAHDGFLYGFAHQQLKTFNNYSYNVVAENLASLPSSKFIGGGNVEYSPIEAARIAFDSWKNSPGHYANILNPDVVYTGVGYNKNGLWTQLFTRRADDKTAQISTKSYNFQGKTTVRYSGLIGKEATVSAVAYESFSFVSWVDELTGQIVSTNADYTFTLTEQDNNKVFVAHFEKAAYKFTVNIKTVKMAGGQLIEETNTGGKVNGVKDYKYGEKVVLEAVPYDLYEFYGWFINDDFTKPPMQKNKLLNIVAGEDFSCFAVFKKVSQVKLNIVLDGKYNAKLKTIIDKDTTNAITSVNGKTFLLKDFEAQWSGLYPELESYDYDNYLLSHWINEKTGQIYELSGNSTGFILYLTETEMVIKPVFVPSVFKINAKITGQNGIVLGLGANGYFDRKGTATITANPDNGYLFSHWADLAATHEAYANPIRNIKHIIGKNTQTVEPIFIKKQEVTVYTENNTPEAGNITPTRAYFAGEKVTVFASITDISYKFVGWFINETLVSSRQEYTFVAGKDVELNAKYEKRVEQIKLDIINDSLKGDYVIYADNQLASGKLFDYGTIIRIVATADKDYEFLGYYSNAREISINREVSFVIYSDTSVVIEYSKRQVHTVIFIDMDGTILSRQQVADGGQAVAPSGLTKTGYVFLGFDISIDKLEKVEQNYVIKALYEKKDKYTVTVTDGTMDRVGNQFFMSDKITLTANTVKGRKFSHWMNSGVLVSYQQELKIIVEGNADYKAVFVNANDSVVNKPIVSLSNKAYDNGKITYFAKVEVPQYYTLIECGVIMVADKDAEEINHSTVGAAIVKSYEQSSTGQFYVTKTDAADIDTYKSVAYLQYKDSQNNIYTIYSNMI